METHRLITMPYEPSTIECRMLISAKEHILEAQQELSSLHSRNQDCSSLIDKLAECYRELETMHASVKEPLPF